MFSSRPSKIHLKLGTNQVNNPIVGYFMGNVSRLFHNIGISLRTNQVNNPIVFDGEMPLFSQYWEYIFTIVSHYGNISQEKHNKVYFGILLFFLRVAWKLGLR